MRYKYRWQEVALHSDRGSPRWVAARRAACLMPSPRTAPRLGSCSVTASESGALKGTASPAGIGSSQAPLFLRANTGKEKVNQSQ